MLWQTLVATPVISPLRTDACSPARVFSRTFFPPRRSLLTISDPSMLIRGEALPAFFSFWQTSSVRNCPLVKIWN